MVITVPSTLPPSLWAATAMPAPVYTRLAADSAADVIVIGAGYTGLSTALHLSQSGKKVIVIDANEPGWGASGRNGGQIIAGLRHEPNQMEATFGSRLGKDIAETMGKGADLVASLIERYHIGCHASFTGWIQTAYSLKTYEKKVLPRYEQWRDRGVGVRLLDRAEVAAMVGSPPSLYAGGWYDPRGGLLQPLSYARGLAAAALSEGATIHCYARARQIRSDGDKWIVDLGAYNLSASKVIIATNAYSDDLWPGLRQTVIPVASFQIATEPLRPSICDTILPGGQGVTDTRRLLKYFRLDHEGRLLMGGRSPVEDNPTVEHGKSLRAVLTNLFPQTADVPIQYVWSGKIALTKDTFPHAHILAPGLYAALGCNGRGVAICTVIGKIMADLASGAEPANLSMPVSAPDPFAFHSLRKIGVFAMSHYYKLMDRLDED